MHADIKGANILTALGKDNGAQAYLVDFGLACHYTKSDNFKPDPKNMHNGTIEYTSRDAHHGVSTMRGDMEILAYNLIHWCGITLPWETSNILKVPVKVQEAKETFMKDTDIALKQCFVNGECPCKLRDLNYLFSIYFIVIFFFGSISSNKPIF